MKSVGPQIDILDHADRAVVGDNVSDRSSTYLTTKYMPTHQPHSSSAVYDYLVKSVPKLNKGKSIEEGGYIDLMLIHAPFGGEKGRTENWAALARAQKEGWIKDIGVSNLYVNPFDDCANSKWCEASGESSRTCTGYQPDRNPSLVSTTTYRRVLPEKWDRATGLFAFVKGNERKDGR